jgi:putative transposase of IS4/5 family DUF4096
MLPNKPRGVPRVNDRHVLNGIFWVLRSGAPWRDLPERFWSVPRPATIVSFAGDVRTSGPGSRSLEPMAKGCIKGAVVGGMAGHMAGHGKARRCGWLRDRPSRGE